MGPGDAFHSGVRSPAAVFRAATPPQNRRSFTAQPALHFRLRLRFCRGKSSGWLGTLERGVAHADPARHAARDVSVELAGLLADSRRLAGTSVLRQLSVERAAERATGEKLLGSPIECAAHATGSTFSLQRT